MLGGCCYQNYTTTKRTAANNQYVGITLWASQNCQSFHSGFVVSVFPQVTDYEDLITITKVNWNQFNLIKELQILPEKDKR